MQGWGTYFLLIAEMAHEDMAGTVVKDIVLPSNNGYRHHVKYREEK